MRGVGHQGLEHAFVGHRRELTLEAAPLLAQQRRETAGPLTQRLGRASASATSPWPTAVSARLGVEHREVEIAQPRLHQLLVVVQLANRGR